jgi:hypothetical protein
LSGNQYEEELAIMHLERVANKAVENIMQLKYATGLGKLCVVEALRDEVSAYYWG